MALSADRSDTTSTRTAGNPVVPPTHQRRDMAVVWWSTYLSLLFLAFFVYGLASAVKLTQDPQPMAGAVAILGVFTMVPWALALLRARRGVDTTTFRTRTMGCACGLAFPTALISLGAPPALGVGALPLAFVLATSALSLGEGRWWVILVAMFPPAVYLYVTMLFSGQPGAMIKTCGWSSAG